jgi:hypothetical protein
MGKLIDFFKRQFAAICAGSVVGGGGAGDTMTTGLKRFTQAPVSRYRGGRGSGSYSSDRIWRKTHGYSGAKLARRAAAGTVGLARIK